MAHLTPSACLNDDAFGPSVRGCRGNFDFTLTFERVILSILPGCIFISLGLVRLAFLVPRPRIVRGLTLQLVKIAIATAYAALQLSLLILLSLDHAPRGKGLSVASVAVTFTAALIIIPLSYAEHSRTHRPSILLNGYIALTLLLDIAHTRTLWLIADSSSWGVLLARLFTGSIATKTLLLVVEAKHKSRWLRWDSKEHSPEETNGLFGLGVFSWLNRLFIKGYKSVFMLDDLYPLDSSMATEMLSPRLETYFQHNSGKFSLARAITKAYLVPWLLPIAPRLALIAFRFSQPLFIESLLEHLHAERDSDGTDSNTGYGLIGAALLIYVGIAVSGALFNYYKFRVVYMIRGCLAAAVYRKTLEASSTTLGGSEALTLMSTDIERIVRSFPMIHDLWGSLVEVAIGCWLLQRQLGAAFVAPIVTIIVCTAIIAQVSSYSGKRQRVWMSAIEKRVGSTSTVIAHMKSLKISGIVGHVFDAIQGLRADEIRAGNYWRGIIVISVIVALAPQALAPVFTFAVTSRTLDTTTIFTSMSYILLVGGPLGILLQSLPGLMAGFACLSRIQDFLETKPRVDYRKTHYRQTKLAGGDDTGSITAGVVSSGGIYTPVAEDPPNLVIEVDSPTSMATISGGSFGWTPNKLSLTNINASIRTGQLTIIVGPVASGKSTFCHALLGEIPYAQGQVRMFVDPGRVSFCEQSPFLLNATLRDNIVGYSPFDQARYDEVIEATRLGLDVSLMPSGHDTEIGSNGIVLSGGQKQRVSLARALYFHADLAIFDDVLSGLDNDTETELFNRVFGPSGLLRRRGTTAVLCTHSVRHLPVADHIIALGSDGAVVEDGNFLDLVKNNSYVQGLDIQTSKTDSAETDSSPDIPVSSPEHMPKTQPKVLANQLDKARQMGDWKVYAHYFSTTSGAMMASIFVLGVLFGFGDNMSTIWMGFWSEDRLSRGNSFYIGIFALFRAGQLVWVFLGGIIILISLVTVTGTALHRSALRTVVTAPLSFFTNTDMGVVTNLFSQDLTLVDGELPFALLNICFLPFELVGMAVVIAIATPYLASGYPVLFLVLYLVQKFYLRTSRQLRLLDLEAKSPLYTHFTDTIRGVTTIRAFAWSEHNIHRNNALVNTSQRPAYLLIMIQQWLALVLQLVVAALAVILVSLATQLEAAPSFTGASLVTLINFSENLSYIVIMYTMLETSIGAVARLKTFGEAVRPEDLPGETVVPPEEWPQRGKIEIRNLSASYAPVEDTDGPGKPAEKGFEKAPSAVLTDISLIIEPGEKVAICGRTGSGKSSLFLVLLRLLDPVPSSSSNITIDSLGLHRVDRATLRQRIIAVAQDPVFLPGGNSIRMNLDPAGVASDAECLDVLRAVQLESFVRLAGEDGLDSEMRAESLSAGQKQLFSLGRAILRRRVRAGKGIAGGILLLDEVSSSVDRETDRMMHEAIVREFAGYTVIMISHRLEMVRDFFDTVVVLDQGKVVERGPPRALIEMEGGRFRDLWVQGNHGT